MAHCDSLVSVGYTHYSTDIPRSYPLNLQATNLPDVRRTKPPPVCTTGTGPRHERCPIAGSTQQDSTKQERGTRGDQSPKHALGGKTESGSNHGSNNEAGGSGESRSYICDAGNNSFLEVTTKKSKKSEKPAPADDKALEHVDKEDAEALTVSCLCAPHAYI